MQNLTSTLGRLAVVLAGALTLGSCSRSEYAFLPKSASYLGTTTAAPKARVAASSPIAAPAEVAQAPVVAPAPVAEAPAVAPEIVVATAPAPRVAPAPVAAPQAMAQAAPAAAVTPDATVATAAPKSLNLVQRMALAKVTKKMNKLAAKASQFKQGDNTASTARGGLDGKLRYAIIFGAISLIFFIIGGSVGNLIGAILLIIALLFLLFWLLDNL